MKRKSRIKIIPNKQQLIDDYFNSFMSTVDISKKWNISKGTVYNLFKKYNIKARVRNSPESQQALNFTKRSDMISNRLATLDSRYGTRSLAHLKDFKKITFNEVKFRSSWEALFARWLTSNNITWEYEPRLFKLSSYEYRSYTPDFYLPDTDQWIEVKGRFYPKTRDQLLIFKNEYSDIFKKIQSVTHYPGCYSDIQFKNINIYSFKYINDIKKETL